MVGIVVRNGYAVDSLEYLKTSARAVKSFGARDYLIHRYARIVRRGNSRKSVVYIVFAGYAEAYPADILAVFDYVKTCKLVLKHDVVGSEIVAFFETEGDELFVLDPRDGTQCVCVVAVIYDLFAGHRSKLRERSDEVVERLEVVEVILVYIKQNADVGRERKESVNKFARLAEHMVALADKTVCACERKLSADNSRRIFARLDEYLGEHRCCRGLAVSAADADAVVKHSRYRAEHLLALKGRDSRCLCRAELRIVGEKSGGVDYHLRALNILGSLS